MTEPVYSPPSSAGFCSNCGSPFNLNQYFCGHCGTPRSTTATPSAPSSIPSAPSAPPIYPGWAYSPQSVRHKSNNLTIIALVIIVILFLIVACVFLELIFFGTSIHSTFSSVNSGIGQ